MPWRHCVFTDAGVVFPPYPPLKTQQSRSCGSGSGAERLPESVEQIELIDATDSAAT
jgi:hypothetical protein